MATPIFNPADYMIARRTSARGLGVARTDYFALNRTGKSASEERKEAPRDTEDQEKIVEGGRKRKSRSVSEVSQPAKRIKTTKKKSPKQAAASRKTTGRGGSRKNTVIAGEDSERTTSPVALETETSMQEGSAHEEGDVEIPTDDSTAEPATGPDGSSVADSTIEEKALTPLKEDHPGVDADAKSLDVPPPEPDQDIPMEVQDEVPLPLPDSAQNSLESPADQVINSTIETTDSERPAEDVIAAHFNEEHSFHQDPAVVQPAQLDTPSNNTDNTVNQASDDPSSLEAAIDTDEQEKFSLPTISSRADSSTAMNETASIASSSSLSSVPSNLTSPMPSPVLATLATPTPIQARPRRMLKPVERFGDFVKPVAEKNFSAIEEDVEDPEAEEVSSHEDGEVASSGKYTAKRAPRRRQKPREVLSTQEESTSTPRGRKRKQPDGDSLPKGSAKRKQRLASILSKDTVLGQNAMTSSHIVKLRVTAPRYPVAKTSSLKEAGSKIAPRTPAQAIFPLPKTGILTPPDSQQPRRSGSAEATDILAEIDPQKLALSEKMTARKPLDLKSPPLRQPEVWADSRQALCETVPYFKMPQSGCHQNDHHVYAFLFDNVGHVREYMDSELVISRAGGGMEADSSGQMVQKKDHLMTESQVVSVLNDAQLQNPLVLICGDKQQGALCKMPHRYNVLGWYKPIFVWAEKTSGKGTKKWTTIKYRFERLGNKPAWHEVADFSTSEEERRVAGPLTHHTCSHCQHQYPMVYLVGWMCLNQDCEKFWQLSSGEEAGLGKLPYNPAFLLHRTPWQVEEEPYSVKPPVPDVGQVIGDNLTYINTRGMCCPQCGRCSHRRLFKGWRCDNAECTYENFPRHIPVKIPMLHMPWESTGEGPAQARNKHAKDVKVEVSYVKGFKVYTYTFEGIKGKFVHATSNTLINRQPGGADEMFTALQNQDDPDMDMHLERRRFGGGETTSDETVEATKLKKPQLEDGDYMTAFSMNYGMPYKFVASGASLPFTEAPWPVRACRADLNWASQTFLDPEDHVDLNEELIFAYLEGQKIEYHDDGETGLGPRITTLSLGGKAKMHMRMKMKHYTGNSKQGIFTSERPVPGGLEYERRLEAWEAIQPLKDTDKRLYKHRCKEIPLELDIYSMRNKKAEDLVTITLNHGDIVLMDGYEIQQYLEHKVVPEGPLRFALTCRTVLPDHLKPDEKPSYEVEADDGSMSGLRKMAERMEREEAERRAGGQA